MKNIIFKTTGISLPIQIEDAPLSASHNALHIQFHVSILNIISEPNAAIIGIPEVRTYYQQLYDKEDLAFKQVQAYEQTGQVKPLDKNRDDIYRFIRDTVNTNLRSLEPEKQQASEKLAYALKPYVKSENTPYDEETALLTNLVQDLQKSAYAAAVETLGLTATVVKLQEANEQFNEVYNSRIDDKAARAATDNMKTVRPQIDEAYRATVQIINAYHTTNELAQTPDPTLQATLTDIITAINGQVIQFRQNITNVGKKSKNEK